MGDILRKAEVSFVSCHVFFFLIDCMNISCLISGN